MLVRHALRSFVRGAPLAAAMVALLGCGAAPAAKPRAPRPTGALKTPAPPPPAYSGPPLLPAHVVAQLDDEEVAPSFARRGDEALLVWTAGGKWWSRRLAADGAPKAEAIEIGEAAANVPVATLRATSSGYLAAWIEDQRGTRAIRALSLDPAGKPAGAPILVLQSADEIAWVEVLPSAQGVSVLWEVPRDDGMDVVAAGIAGGKAATPAVVARDVLGWQAAAAERGAAVAVVRRASGKPGGDDAEPKLGQVALVELDASGKPGAPVVVSGEATAQIDIELGLVDGKYLLAWTDERDMDASVHVAVVEPGGRVASPPRRATAPAGEQALVSLVTAPYMPGAAPARRALLAWEDVSRASREARLIHLAAIGSDGALGKEQAGLLMSASGPPDLAIDGDGFAALTLAPASGPADAAQQEGEGPPIWPTFVRFGPDLGVRASEPVRAEPFLATGGVPYLVRGLSCAAGQCTALASAAAVADGPGKPASAPLAAVSLPVRQGPWRAPALRDRADAVPRATSVRALYDGDHVARVAATDLGGGRAVGAWVTYYLEGAGGDKKAREQGATLAVRAVGPDGLGKLNVLSQKASSFGGAAIAAAPGDKPESVLAWVAREKGEAQVYVTKLDASGEKVTQKKLTTAPRRKQQGAPNEPTDVAVAHDGQDGWIVAWIDTRDGNAEVYAARVDKNLQKVGADRRITEAPGDAAEVQIMVRGKEAWLIWSDARGNDETGDIWMARLDAKTLQKVGQEARLYTSPEHSRTPALASHGKGALAAWIEEPAGDGAATGGAVRWVLLDERGMLQGAPAPLPVQDAAPVAVTLACGADACRAVMTVAEGEVLSLRGVEMPLGGRPGEARTLGVLTGNSAQDVSPVFAGPGALFFSDDALSGAGRVRWMTIAWKP